MCQWGGGTLVVMRRAIGKKCCECGADMIGATGRGRQRCGECQIERVKVVTGIMHDLGSLSNAELLTLRREALGAA